MQAHVSILIKHCQLLQYDADPSSPTTASSDLTHKLCDRCVLEPHMCLALVQRSDVHKIMHAKVSMLVDQPLMIDHDTDISSPLLHLI